MTFNRCVWVFVAFLACVLGYLAGAIDAVSYAEDKELSGTAKATEIVPSATANTAPRCELSGHIVGDNGVLISGATIQVWTLDGSDIDLMAARPHPPTTDADGRYSIADLPAGDYAIRARLEFKSNEKSGHCLSAPYEISLSASQRAYRRLSLPARSSPDGGARFLYQGSVDVSKIWSTWKFDPQGMQVVGDPAPQRENELIWGESVAGLQTALILEPGKSPTARAATLIVRNVLPDQMVAFDRHRARENFAFEVIHSDGSVQVIKRSIWPFNRLNPEHQMNRIFLRPEDEYQLTLGEFEIPALIETDKWASVRTRLNLFTNDQGPDRPLQAAVSTSQILETGWVALGDEPPRTPGGLAGLHTSRTRLFVVDAETEQPIRAFAVIAGYVDSWSDGQTEGWIRWAPSLWQEGKSGRLDWPWKQRFSDMRLRVEVDGYRPGITQIIRATERPVVILIKLVRDSGISGRVVTPDGKPAHLARVAVAMFGSHVVIWKGRLDNLPAGNMLPANKWYPVERVETNQAGQFHLPPEVSRSKIVVTHESGYAELSRDRLTPGSSTITLRPWSRIEGQLLWGAQPGAQAVVCLDVWREGDSRNSASIIQSERVTTDVEGRFVIPRVIAGRASVYHNRGTDPVTGRYLPWHASFPAVDAHVNSIGPTSVVVGGLGRPAIGRLVGRADWTGITVRMVRRPPQLADEAQRNGYRQYRTSVEGVPYHPAEVAPNADGTFRIERVPAAGYQCQVRESLKAILARRNIDVDFMPNGTSDVPLNLGTIDMTHPK